MVLSGIGICRVSQAVAHEVQRQDRDYHGEPGQQEPRRGGDGSYVLGLLQEHAPTHDRGLQAEPKNERAVSARIMAGTARVREAMTWLANEGEHVAQDDARLAGAVELGCRDEVLPAQREEAPLTTLARSVQPIRERMIVIPK